MKKITLLIDDDVYDHIRSEVTVYNLAWAGGTTAPIQFISRIIDAVDKGDNEYHFEFKDKGKTK